MVDFFRIEDVVKIEPLANAECYINGSMIVTPTELVSGARVILGKSHVFRFNNPLASKFSPTFVLSFNRFRALSKPFIFQKRMPRILRK